MVTTRSGRTFTFLGPLPRRLRAPGPQPGQPRALPLHHRPGSLTSNRVRSRAGSPTHAHQTNVFHLPEIRLHIGRFLSSLDLTVCIRVCKLWYTDFHPYIWHTIDLLSDKSLLHEKHADLLYRNGHLVRKIQAPFGNLQPIIFNTLSINRLEDLSIELSSAVETNTLAYEHLRRNIRTLKELVFYFYRASLRGKGQRDNPVRNIPIEILTMGANMRLLMLRGVNMTRDAFSGMLKGMPLLKELRLQSLIFVADGTEAYFQHEKIEIFCGDVDQMWAKGPEADKEAMPVHFPNLVRWNMWNYGFKVEVTSETMRLGLQKYLPRLKEVDFDEYKGGIVSEMLADTFERGLERITMLYTKESVDVIVTLTSSIHSKRLSHLTLNESNYDLDSDDIAEDDDLKDLVDQIEEPWMIILVVNAFPNLKTLWMPLHQVKLRQLEPLTTWGCVHLEALEMRVEGLDDYSMIRNVIQIVREGRAKERRGLLVGAGQENEDTVASSVEEKVARHLLKFKKLKMIWLGSITFYL